MIDTYHFKPNEVRKAYDRRSKLYARIVAPVEREYHQIALDVASLKPHERILEVAIGPGRTLLEILKRVHRDNVVHGVDISEQMIEIARQYVSAAGYDNFDLTQANARHLEFDSGTFDVLYNAYMLDLIPLNEMHDILAEFKRVLKPGGRLVLLNMSKEQAADPDKRERLYRFLPRQWVLYLAGGCRPVLMEEPVKQAGFRDIKRQFIGGKAPSEVIVAHKPVG